VSDKKFVIRATMRVVIPAKDIWPDGDMPDNPTTKDVADRIDDDGGFSRVLDDWNLRDKLIAVVSADGEKDAGVTL
jgi:hypothetical protein